MSIKPTITEISFRRYNFDLTEEQIRKTIIDACAKAAGIDEFPIDTCVSSDMLITFSPINVRFDVPVDAEQILSGDGVSAPIKGEVTCGHITAPAKAYPDIIVTAGEAGIEAHPAASAPVSAPNAAEPSKAAPAARTVPVRASAKSARPMAWAGLTSQERSIVLHLERLPDTFSPVDDLNIVQCLTSSVKAPAIALEMDITAEEVVARWKAMWCSAVLESSRTPTIEGQKRLLAALRYRVETEG